MRNANSHKSMAMSTGNAHFGGGCSILVHDHIIHSIVITLRTTFWDVKSPHDLIAIQLNGVVNKNEMRSSNVLITGDYLK